MYWMKKNWFKEDEDDEYKDEDVHMFYEFILFLLKKDFIKESY